MKDQKEIDVKTINNTDDKEDQSLEEGGNILNSEKKKEHNENCLEQIEDPPNRSVSSRMSKMYKLENTVAQCIAREALEKASKIISKNERVQKEYNGIGLNNGDEGCDSRERLDTYWKGERMNCAQSETDTQPKWNCLHGAQPIMLGNNKELLEKLKSRLI
ncbi:conserved Plasmodium protein, unknown function [Plasmodium gonderi]|uniref:Uncharacterized protein n=1 Tax=Plasmodium gonderi TaxID=77519 RepID=A0A1Y1JBW3_PLAGO|nr:conserved Plasmodium protein, unknown function [Plasmodium gonderi]GAW79986.1 conserved Plasmodium protein, unknown function [Plasmodium gonderi]